MAGAALGVGVVGAGFGARVIVPAVEKAGLRLVGIASRTGVDTAPGVSVYNDWRVLLDAPDVDIVAVATPPESHAEIALAAIECGKAVFCEKPLALTGEGAAAVAAAAARRGVPGVVDFEFRAHPHFMEARRRVVRGDLGEILGVSVRWHVPTRLEVAGAPTWKDDARRGGGALMSLAIHSLDYVEWLVGPLTSIVGTLATAYPRVGVDSDDTCAAIARAKHGIVATFDVSTVSRFWRHDIVVRGSNCTLELANDGPDYLRDFVFRVGGETLQPVGGSDDGRIAPVAELLAGLASALHRRGAECSPSLADGARAQRLVDAWRVSASTGGSVEVVTG
jgi:predicted dehydrogenase